MGKLKVFFLDTVRRPNMLLKRFDWNIFLTIHVLPSLKLTWPLKIGLPNRKVVFNHPFLGAMLNFGGGGVIYQFITFGWCSTSKLYCGVFWVRSWFP